MAFIYDVEITTHSIIEDIADGMPVGEPEINIGTNRGFMRCEEGKLTLNYSETQEGGRVATQLELCELPRQICTACADSGKPLYRVRLTKRGGIESDMTFEEGKSSESLYRIPPYSFDMTVATVSIKADLNKAGGELRLRYSMTVGGQSRFTRLNIKVKRL